MARRKKCVQCGTLSNDIGNVFYQDKNGEKFFCSKECYEKYFDL